MPELSQEQQKAIDEQKAQCPFCKIVKGEIPSKAVYEDDRVIALLDINPARKGHVLIMPKEHYPIMPLIPPDEFRHFFIRVRDVSKAVKDAQVVFKTNLFIANGPAAGQQSSHFMLHIVPREDGDGISVFDLPLNELEGERVSQVREALKNNLPIMMANHLQRTPLPGVGAATAPGYTKEQVLGIIEKNPQLKEVLVTKTEWFKEQIPNDSQLSMLFSKVDIDELVSELKGEKEAEVVEEKKTEQSSKSKEPSFDELIALLDENPKLKTLLLENTEGFIQKVLTVEKLQELFGSIDVKELKKKILEKEGKTETRSEEKKEDDGDLDLVSRMFS